MKKETRELNKYNLRNLGIFLLAIVGYVLLGGVLFLVCIKSGIIDNVETFNKSFTVFTFLFNVVLFVGLSFFVSLGITKLYTLQENEEERKSFDMTFNLLGLVIAFIGFYFKSFSYSESIEIIGLGLALVPIWIQIFEICKKRKLNNTILMPSSYLGGIFL
ncbi:hypothetical protein JZO72_09040 [Vagococcus fluvialis]|uniref:hypothetical protein n=1 Tax=Vagococcus fluvialis TaxID=2738 RepID=UPI001A8F9455|nr:hypothetical protein [Vagococcus fluvialis]MBO0479771.1 hypothetical protein [Vagococcus fluvialis]MBO0483325.1 hypothetical protein [Vagococcus fluvialis]